MIRSNTAAVIMMVLMQVLEIQNEREEEWMEVMWPEDMGRKIPVKAKE